MSPVASLQHILSVVRSTLRRSVGPEAEQALLRIAEHARAGLPTAASKATTTPEQEVQMLLDELAAGGARGARTDAHPELWRAGYTAGLERAIQVLVPLLGVRLPDRRPGKHPS